MLLFQLRHSGLMFVLGLLPSRFLKDRRAVTAIEYAMIAGVIIIAIVTGVAKIGSELSPTFNSVSSEL
jgi:pilus assembly protein Flp/PilA